MRTTTFCVVMSAVATGTAAPVPVGGERADNDGFEAPAVGSYELFGEPIRGSIIKDTAVQQQHQAWLDNNIRLRASILYLSMLGPNWQSAH